MIRVDDTGAPGDPYEEFLAGGVARAAGELARRRGGDDLDQLHVRHDRPPEGRPVHVPRRLPERAQRGDRRPGSSPESVFLWLQPMFHCNGWCFAWGVTAVAGRHVTIRKVDPDLIWDLIDAEGVTNFNGAPTVQLMVINHPKAHRVERPVTVVVAAAPPSPTLFARMDELNFRVIHVYGLTETYGPTTMCPEQEEWRDAAAAERRQAARAPGPGVPLGRSRARRRRGDERRPARRRDDGRGRDARQHRHGRLLRRPRGDRRRHSAAAGSTPATSRSGIRTGTSSSATAARTSSSRAARTSPRSRWSRRSSPTRRCSSAPSSRSRTRTGASGPRPS